MPIINLAFFLDTSVQNSLRNWVLLNQSVCQELGQESGGLRAIVRDQSNQPLYLKLQGHFNPKFLNLSPDNASLLEESKQVFKTIKKRFCLVVYIFKTLQQSDMQDWLIINSSLLYHQELN